MTGWMRRIAAVGLSVGLSLTSLEAGAFATARLEARDREGAAAELAAKLGHATPDACQLQPMNLESRSVFGGWFFRMTCPDRSYFIKYDDESRAESFSALFNLTEHRLSPELASSILPSLGEFSFDIGQRVQPGKPARQGYYSVYPWVEGVTLGELFETMSESGFDAQRLTALYQAIGSRLGSMQRAGLADASKPLHQLRSRLTHRDLHQNNIMVTPDDGIVIIDLDAFETRERPQRVMNFVSDSFPLLLFFDDVIMDRSRSSVWLALLPDMTHSLLHSYCKALVGEQALSACRAELGDRLIEVTRKDGQRTLDNWAAYGRSFDQDLGDLVPVDRLELDRRLALIFGHD